jgi:uncharacterized protein (DUF58 family)
VGLIESALAFGSLRLLAVPAAALLMIFAAAMAINILRGRSHIDCGCGRSQLRQPLHWGMVVRNLLLAALVAVHAVPPATGETPATAEVALALAAGTCLFLVTVLFNALAALATSPLARGRS